MASRRAPGIFRVVQRTSASTFRPSQSRLQPSNHSIHASTPHARAAAASVRFSSSSTSPSPPNNAHSSVDPAEVSHFNALASSWWDPHGPSRLLHLMNQLRHPFIQQCLASQPTPPPPRLRYLDVGCGGGIFAESAARHPNTESVVAIDPSPEVLAIADSHKRRDPLLMQAGRLTYKNIPIEKLPLPGKPEEGFDVVSCFEVIEHVTAPAEFLQRLMPHVRPGGWLVMSTIARTWASWATTKVAAEDILGIVPRGTHDWNKYINEDELRGWFAKQQGWESPRAMGVMYLPGLGWKKIRGSEKLGNYFFAARRSEV